VVAFARGAGGGGAGRGGGAGGGGEGPDSAGERHLLPGITRPAGIKKSRDKRLHRIRRAEIRLPARWGGRGALREGNGGETRAARHRAARISPFSNFFLWTDLSSSRVTHRFTLASARSS
jgi:hypothetical protein